MKMNCVTKKIEFWQEFETLHTIENGIEVNAICEQTYKFEASDDGYLNISIENLTKWLDNNQKKQHECETNHLFELPTTDATQLRDFLIYVLSRVE